MLWTYIKVRSGWLFSPHTPSYSCNGVDDPSVSEVWSLSLRHVKGGRVGQKIGPTQDRMSDSVESVFVCVCGWVWDQLLLPRTHECGAKPTVVCCRGYVLCMPVECYGTFRRT